MERSSGAFVLFYFVRVITHRDSENESMVEV